MTTDPYTESILWRNCPWWDAVSSAGETTGNGSTGHGHRYFARALGEGAVVAGRTDTFLGDRYDGSPDGGVRIEQSSLPSAAPSWSSLAPPERRGVTVHDLGPDHCIRHIHPDTKKSAVTPPSNPSATPTSSPLDPRTTTTTFPAPLRFAEEPASRYHRQGHLIWY